MFLINTNKMPPVTRLQSKASPLKSFPFIKLPSEIQQIIWSFSLTSQTHYTSPKESLTLIKSPPLPVALLVNHLSRKTAQRHLSLFSRDGGVGTRKDVPYGYFNKEVDILHIDSLSTIRLNSHLATLPFRRISIGWDFRQDATYFPSPITIFDATRTKVYFYNKRNALRPRGHGSCEAVRPIFEPNNRMDEVDRIAESLGSSDEISPARCVGDMYLCCDCPDVYTRMRRKWDWKMERQKK